MPTEEILQRCLEDMAAGRKTAEACAAQYPQLPELLAQLRSAEALKPWVSLTVGPEAARRHRAQLRVALAAAQPRRRRPALWPRWAMAAALVVALVLAGAGTVSAAAGSLPGQALYPVKRAAEGFQGAFIPPASQAAWRLSLAEERTHELQAVSAQGLADPALLDQIAAELGAETEAALAAVAGAAASEQAALLQTILASIDRQADVLLAVRATLPVTAQAGLDRALAVSNSNRELALARLSTVQHQPDDPPGQGVASRTPVAAGTDVPPGQAKKTATAQATDVPPGQAKKTATAQATDIPPGQEKKTATAAALVATPTSPGNSGGQGSGGTPNCSANSPNSPNFCTPTPTPPQGSDGGGAVPPPTQCPLNPAGHPVCGNRP